MFTITDEALVTLRGKEMPEAVLSKPKSLKDKLFATQDKLSEALASTLSKEELGAGGTGAEQAEAKLDSRLRRVWPASSFICLTGQEKHLFRARADCG